MPFTPTKNLSNENLLIVLCMVGIYFDLPCASDSDNDSIADGLDDCPALKNPNREDADSDGIGDVCETLTDYDGKTSNVVKIGPQLWLKEYLNVTHYKN